MIDTGFHASFFLFCGVLLWLALRGIWGGRTLFEFPTLAALLGIAWIVPQGIALESSPINLYGSDEFWLYATGCFLLIHWGFQAGRRAKLRRMQRAPEREITGFDSNRLLVAAAGLTVLGYVAEFQMRSIDTAGMGSQWTGIITMWSLLSKASGFALCLAVIVFARTKSHSALVVAVAAALPLCSAAFLSVRRETLFDLGILTVGAWYLVRGRVPPRAAVLATLLVGIVILNTVGEIRTQVITGQSSFFNILTSPETYRRFDFFNPDQRAASEVGQAQYDFWYVNQTGELNYGADFYNSLVWQYVPAFLVGREFKESLKIATLSERLRRGDQAGEFALGSTRTGFSDSYCSFGVFGILVFAAIGYAFGMLYAASGAGGVSGQYYYLILLAEGLKAITHGTSDFFIALPFTIGLSFLALNYAGSRAIRQSSHMRPPRFSG